LWPFPTKEIERLAQKAKGFMVIELSAGQMVEDVRLAVNGKVPVEFHGRMGGNIPSSEEIVEKFKEKFKLK
jgi:2-oxoglutarate ferredoxin oxidoreductase subunit alpha